MKHYAPQTTYDGYLQWRIYIVKFWTRPPHPNSFNFMQFWGKFGKIVCWRPHLGEILDPPLIFMVRENSFYSTEMWRHWDIASVMFLLVGNYLRLSRWQCTFVRYFFLEFFVMTMEIWIVSLLFLGKLKDAAVICVCHLGELHANVTKSWWKSSKLTNLQTDSIFLIMTWKTKTMPNLTKDLGLFLLTRMFGSSKAWGRDLRVGTLFIFSVTKVGNPGHSVIDDPDRSLQEEDEVNKS